MKLYVLIDHNYEDYRLIGAFTSADAFKHAYKRLEAKLESEYGDVEAFCLEANKEYFEEHAHEAWVLRDEINCL